MKTRAEVALSGCLRPAALGLGLLALGLPANSVAQRAAAVGTGEVALLVQGLWLFKICLLLLAAGVWLIAEYWMRSTQGTIDLEKGPPGENVDYRWVFVILTIALVLRLIGINQGLWYDEVFTLVHFVRLPTLGILTSFSSQNNHLLYSLLARPSVLLFGESAFALRLPAVIFGVGSLWALFGLTNQVSGRREAYLATGLLTVSYHHIWFSQNARGYTGLLFFTLVSTSIFVSLLRGGRRLRLLHILTYGSAAAGGVFVNLTGGFTIVAHSLVWAVATYRRKLADWRAPGIALLLSGLLASVLYAPVFPQLLATLFGTGGEMVYAWQSPWWLLTEMAGGLSSGLPGGWLTLVLGTAVAAIGVVSFTRSGLHWPALMLLPAILMTCVLILTSQNLWPRYYFFAAGFAAMIATRGWLEVGELLAGRRGVKLATAAQALGIVLSVGMVPGGWAAKQDFIGAARHIESVSGSNDVAVTAGLTTLPFRTYLGLPWTSVEDVDQLRDLEGRHEEVRILITFPTQLEAGYPEVWNHVGSEYREEAVFPGTVAGGEIRIMVRP